MMMRKVPFAAMTFTLACAATAIVFAGCGSDPASDAGDAASEAGGEGGGFGDAALESSRADGPECVLVGQSCAKSTDCCTANCAGGTCQPPTNACKAPGVACASNIECCTFSCVGGSCSSKLCVADSLACGADGECCGGRCEPDATGAGKCTPLGPKPTTGNPCTTNAECASGYCNAGICATPSFCVQPGDACANNFDCCSGNCTKAAGAMLGTCGTATAGGGVPGCTPAGVVCGGATDASTDQCGGSCCSRSCAPSGTTGLTICQPPSGCRPTGEICRNDSDCCGWSGSPDPKMGFVTCSKASPTAEYGRCDNGGACREPGSICKPADYSCNAENNCCEHASLPSSYCNSNPENCCRRDALGIPRCLIKPVDCTTPPPAGTVCATSADCCGNPCVGNVCGAPTTCAPRGGECTTTADCCSGIPCIAPPGSTKGYCGGGVLPDGGVTSDGGGTGGGTPPCALFGQMCTSSGQCCNGVPCTDSTCRYPIVPPN